MKDSCPLRGSVHTTTEYFRGDASLYTKVCASAFVCLSPSVLNHVVSEYLFFWVGVHRGVNEQVL